MNCKPGRLAVKPGQNRDKGFRALDPWEECPGDGGSNPPRAIKINNNNELSKNMIIKLIYQMMATDDYV